ncbi:MAG TPA: NAD-dependent epimerase/dehydratase family protein [Caulobacteraceae bacterium]
MARTALIVGGSGQIGRAAARRLVDDGWRVVLAQRRPVEAPPGCEALRLDRDESGALARAVGRGFDAVIDTVAFDESHARQLLEVEQDVGTLIVVSSASVYQDPRGRSLDEARETGFPVFPEPIREDHPTVEPGPQTYSTRKVALERTLIDGARCPVTILRPGAIHGPHSTHPREWFFVKRILDGRRRVPLAWSGRNRFHTSAAANIAALVSAVVAKPATRILHAADPEVLMAREIGAAIAQAMDAELELVPFEGPPRGGVGAHPWGVASPIVLDMSRAASLGYRPVGGYQDLVGEACRSAEVAAHAGTAFVPYLLSLFDYAAEDAWLSQAAH